MIPRSTWQQSIRRTERMDLQSHRKWVAIRTLYLSPISSEFSFGLGNLFCTASSGATNLNDERADLPVGGRLGSCRSFVAKTRSSPVNLTSFELVTELVVYSPFIEVPCIVLDNRYPWRKMEPKYGEGVTQTSPHCLVTIGARLNH